MFSPSASACARSGNQACVLNAINCATAAPSFTTTATAAPASPFPGAALKMYLAWLQVCQEVARLLRDKRGTRKPKQIPTKTDHGSIRNKKVLPASQPPSYPPSLLRDAGDVDRNIARAPTQVAKSKTKPRAKRNSVPAALCSLIVSPHATLQSPHQSKERFPTCAAE